MRRDQAGDPSSAVPRGPRRLRTGRAAGHGAPCCHRPRPATGNDQRAAGDQLRDAGAAVALKRDQAVVSRRLQGAAHDGAAGGAEDLGHLIFGNRGAGAQAVFPDGPRDAAGTRLAWSIQGVACVIHAAEKPLVGKSAEPAAPGQLRSSGAKLPDEPCASRRSSAWRFGRNRLNSGQVMVFAILGDVSFARGGIIASSLIPGSATGAECEAVTTVNRCMWSNARALPSLCPMCRTTSARAVASVSSTRWAVAGRQPCG